MVKVGEGAFGKVYKVKSTVGQEWYALKEVNTQFMKKNELDSVKYEAIILQIVSKSNNKYIIELLDSRQMFNSFSMLFPLFDGDFRKYHLKKLFKIGQEDEKYQHVKIFFIRMLNGLKAIHEAGIVHRDMKMENVLVKDDGSRYVISDFGISEKFDSFTKKVRGQAGTPLYMAPEVINNLAYGVKCDIWSLGIIIYEMIDGINPFGLVRRIEDIPIKVRAGTAFKFSSTNFSYYDKAKTSINFKTMLKDFMLVDEPRRKSADEILSILLNQNKKLRVLTGHYNEDPRIDELEKVEPNLPKEPIKEEFLTNTVTEVINPNLLKTIDPHTEEDSHFNPRRNFF